MHRRTLISGVTLTLLAAAGRRGAVGEKGRIGVLRFFSTPALRDRIDALIVVSSRPMTRGRQRILEFATTDLRVERPAARALGLTIPQSLVLRADRVIE